ncbi:MAG: beta-N-acetylhexosaminidase [Candidatus Nitrospinota bacterium M3_3B_026]
MMDEISRFKDSAGPDEAAGQTLITGFEGTRYTPALGAWLRRLAPAGVILFSRNIKSREQAAALTADLKKLGEDTNGLPLFVCVDQEGGRVSRLPGDLPAFPTARTLGEDGGEELARKTYAAMGDALRQIGVNVDFAPVLDLDTNPANPVIGDRAFAPDADAVIKLGRAALRGLADGGVLSCAKHFPGHGGTSLDSHLALPVDARPAARFEEAELRPFMMAAEEGAPFVMTAHVVYPAFDEKLPATLSKKIVTGLLREKIGYGGIVISDDMDMKAISQGWADDEAARLALAAGVDMLLVCHDERRAETARETARRMMIGGELPEDEARARLGRILLTKTKLAAAAGNG